MLLSLLQIRQASQTPTTKKNIIDLIFETSPFMAFMKFETVPSRVSKWFMTRELPTSGFRAYGGSYSSTTSKDDMGETNLKILGGDFSIDRLDQNAQAVDGSKKVAREIRNMTMSMAMKAKYNFINGDLANDPNEFNGLKRFHTADNVFGTSQTLELASAGSTFAAAGGRATLEFLEDFLNQTIVLPDVVFCDETHITQLKALAMSSGTNEAFANMFTTEEYPLPNGRRIKIGRFSGVPFIPMKADAAGNKVIDYNETSPNGANSVCSSMYSMVIGEDFFAPLQHSANGPEITSAIQDGHLKTFLDWAIALEPRHHKCSAKAAAIKAV